MRYYVYLCNAKAKMVDVAQLVRASDCGSEGRRFEPDLPPLKVFRVSEDFFYCLYFYALVGWCGLYVCKKENQLSAQRKTGF